MKALIRLKTTEIRFSLSCKDLQTDIVLEGQLADFFTNVIIGSGLSEAGLLDVLSSLINSKDTKLSITEKNQLYCKAEYPNLFKQHNTTSNKNAV